MYFTTNNIERKYMFHFGKCNSSFTFDCDHFVSLQCPFRSKHELPTMYLFLYLPVFEIPSSSQVVHRQRSQSSLLLLGNSTGLIYSLNPPLSYSGCIVLIVFNRRKPIEIHSCGLYREGGDPLNATCVTSTHHLIYLLTTD